MEIRRTLSQRRRVRVGDLDIQVTKWGRREGVAIFRTSCGSFELARLDAWDCQRVLEWLCAGMDADVGHS